MKSAPDTSAAEASILGSLLEADGAPLPTSLARLVEHAPESFDDQRHGLVAAAVRALVHAGQPVNLVSIHDQLQKAGQLQAVGGSAFLGLLQKSAIGLGLAEADAGPLWQSYQARRAKALLAEAITELDRQPDMAGAILSLAQRGLADLAGEQARETETSPARHWLDIRAAADHADVLIGPGRWVTRGSGVLLPAPTGSGKSTWSATQAFSWALGRTSLGMEPTGRLKSLIFQSEDDDGDLEDMQRGIVDHLAPNEAERALLRENVIIITERAATGLEFLRRHVAPALRKHRPDLLWINPLSAYFGSDLNDQREVAIFFRNSLNPMLAEFRCACFPVHHTAKPNKERGEWAGGQLAYIGAGSADLANWAREVITLRETSPGLYEMTCCKRWRKLGWTDSEGRPTASRLIAHSRDGSQVWRDATADVLDELGATPYSDASLVALVPDCGIDRAELVRLAAERFSLSPRTAATYVSDARREKRRRMNGGMVRCALVAESSRPRREVYPDQPRGREVVWLTKLSPVNATR